jgi:predicted HTH domain antitoxin
MQITIELPDDIAQRLAQTVNSLPQRALESLVVEAYRDELLTHAEVGRILNLPSRWDIDAFLKQAGADLHYDPDDLQADLETLHQLRTNQPMSE